LRHPACLHKSDDVNQSTPRVAVGGQTDPIARSRLARQRARRRSFSNNKRDEARGVRCHNTIIHIILRAYLYTVLVDLAVSLRYTFFIFHLSSRFFNLETGLRDGRLDGDGAGRIQYVMYGAQVSYRIL